MENMIERRRHERFRVKNDFIALLWPASSKVGKIVDISLGGIAIRYLIRSKQKNKPHHALESEIEIVCRKRNALPWTMPIEMVSDIKIGGTVAGAFPLQQRRRSLRFRKLDKKQRQQIENFIHTHGNHIPPYKGLPESIHFS